MPRPEYDTLWLKSKQGIAPAKQKMPTWSIWSVLDFQLATPQGDTYEQPYRAILTMGDWDIRTASELDDIA